MKDSLRFVVSEGGSELRERLDFPDYFANVLASPNVSLLVLVVAQNGSIAGGCSLSGRFNMAVLYIKEEYRRKGVATSLFLETMRIAKKHGDDFLTGAVPPWHVAALGMDFKVGFKVLMRFTDFILLMRPLTFKGEVEYAFLRGAFRLLPESILTRVYEVGVTIAKRSGLA